MTEYAIIVAVLLSVFVLFGLILQKTALFRGKRSAQSVNLSVPCYRNVEAGDSDADLLLGHNGIGGKLTVDNSQRTVLGFTGVTPTEDCL